MRKIQLGYSAHRRRVLKLVDALEDRVVFRRNARCLQRMTIKSAKEWSGEGDLQGGPEEE